MTEQIAQLFSGLPDEFITSCLAALPVTELRGSIPFAAAFLDMTWQQALFWSILGNLIPVPFILKLLEPAERLLCRWSIMERFFRWLYDRTRRKGKLVERYKAIGLILFVSIPLPITGAWTGSVAAHVFGIRFSKAFIAVFAGVCIAGILVTLVVQGIIAIPIFVRM